MKQLTLLVVFLSTISLSSIGQKQADIWHFGDGAGLSFSNGAPVSINGGETYLTTNAPHSEAAATICDSNGNLLFYSNGEKVWNSMHNLMPNGDNLLGHVSSTQGALIVPLPGSSEVFYLFTTDAFLNDLGNGMRYSIIDMCRDNQLGDVVPTRKNILLADTVAEKLIAVKHSNGTDYWVVTHKYNSADFIAFHLSSNGIVNTVTSTTGSIHKDYCIPTSNPYKAAIGQMKASPDGTKIAVVNGQGCDNISELFDFDAFTGVVSNPIPLNTDDVAIVLYGTSFSPDNSKLYIGSNINNDNIYQFDLTAGGGHPDSIRDSKTIVGDFMGGPSQLSFQLGPDGKLYIARRNQTFLAVINEPNLTGIACNFVDTALLLGNNLCSYDLPNIMDSYDYDNGMVGVVGCDPLNVDETDTEKEYTLFPNPMEDHSMLTFNNDERVSLTLTLHDASGRLVRTYYTNNDRIKIEKRELNTGLYLFQLYSNEDMRLQGKLMIE